MGKTNPQTILASLAVALLILPATMTFAMDASTPAPAAMTNAPAPQLSYGVSQIMLLAQANISDDTIVAFIKYSENSYVLDASQIIYLRQQGISETVIVAMLNQPKMVGPMTKSPAAPPVTTPAMSPAPATVVAPRAVDAESDLMPAHYDYSPHCYTDVGSFPAALFSLMLASLSDGNSGGWYHSEPCLWHTGGSSGSSGGSSSGGSSSGGWHGGAGNGRHDQTSGGSGGSHGGNSGGGHDRGSSSPHSGGSSSSHGEGFGGGRHH